MYHSMPRALVVIVWLLSVTYPATKANTVLDTIIGSSTTWNLANSPYLAKSDVTIPSTITVRVEPGVVVQFAPKTTLKVKGTLLAVGTPNRRITFTKSNGNNVVTGSGGSVVPKRARLVDGSEVRMGKLNLMFKDHWVGVCSRNREWTSKDSRVACRELGFADGNFTLLEVAENFTQHVLFEQPKCLGNESSILDCPGHSNISLGSDICHFQEVVSLQCWGINKVMFDDFWKGVEFYNTTLKLQILHTDNSKMNVSTSELSYVDIQYAGVNSSMHHVGAISASPFPPVLKNVRLRWNAYDAINYTRIKGPVEILNSEITENRGHGMNISTAVGHIRIRSLTSTRNGGHGGDIHMLDYHWLDQEVELVHHGITLCGSGSRLFAPLFPFLINAKLEPSFHSFGTCKTFVQTGYVSGQLVTLSLLEAQRDPMASATITVLDARTKKQLAVWPITGTPTRLYQGVSSEFAAGLELIMDWRKPGNQDTCNTFEPCIQVILQASVGKTKHPEVLIQASNFSANVQRGLTVKSPWTYVNVFDSTFERNEFEAGLLIVNGSADVFVNNSRFIQNERTGLNITTAGGTRIVNASRFENTRGHALDIRNQLWLRSRYNTPDMPLRAIVHQSDFVNNWYAMRFYNVCETEQAVLVNVTRVSGSKYGGIEMVSCVNWGHGRVKKESDIKMTNFTVGFSNFTNNAKYVIRVTPMVNMNGSILNSSFVGNGGSKITDQPNGVVTGGGGVIYIHNTENFVQRRLYTRFKVNYFILDNMFTQNTGSFVISAQLVLYSSVQSLNILYNRFLRNSIFKGPGNLNPRSSVHAVVLLSSGNVKCQRNEFANPNSHYEIGTHLESPSSVIKATYNYWGNSGGNWVKKMKEVFGRIFSKIDRHTLAVINYVPLLRDQDLHTIYVTSEPPHRYSFLDRSLSPPELGGSMNSSERTVILTPGVYHVTRDVFVPAEATLTLQPGVKLRFDDSIGLFVKGSLVATGAAATPIVADLWPGSERKPLFNASEQVIIGVRLVRNQESVNDTEGRVEVFIDGEWGTVCDRGFGPREARVVCSQLGLVAHPDDWQLPPLLATANPSQNAAAPIWMSTVRCEPWDLDIRNCIHDSIKEHTCSHDQDVRIRCHERGWAGIRLTTTRRPSAVQNFKMTRGGLLDFFRMEYTPTLQVDFHIHQISHLDITYSLSDGYRCNFNSMWRTRNFAQSTLSNNLGSGLALRSPFFHISDCNFHNNTVAGISYDPHFTESDAYQLRSFMTVTKRLDLTQAKWTTSVQTSGYEFFVMTAKTVPEVKVYQVQLETVIRERLVVQVLDFNPDYAQENVTFYDAPIENLKEQPRKWRIPEDLALFPIVSSGQYLTIVFRINGTRSNRLTLIVESKDMRSVAGSQTVDYYPDSQLIVQNSQFRHNARGIQITHYNDPTDREGDIYIRRKVENITFSNLVFSGNTKEAMHIPSVSRYARELFAPSFSEIVEGSSRTATIGYDISNCIIEDNGAGIYSDHNHVEYSNNVWHYNVTKNTWRRNRRGGFLVELPFVSKRFDWRYEPNIDHYLDLKDNTFLENKIFEVSVTGYHAKIQITQNRFELNECRSKLLSFDGMEKDLNLASNVFLKNKFCTAMVHLDITSQSEVSEYSEASITRNNFISNSCPVDTTMAPPLEMAVLPTCYTVGIFGLQNVTVQYNLFSNNYYCELVAGILSSNIDNIMDCRFNWWGTTSVPAIRKKIFDVDDWNNFLLADFNGFLMSADFDSARSSINNALSARSINADEVLRTGVLGGRVSTDLTLRQRRTPYRVVSDLTVLRTATLKIDAGTTIEFGPNVGLLVFGKLIARGTQLRPITLRPMVKPGEKLRLKRSVANSKTPKKVRLVGGLQPNEGFLQFYNSTADRWDLVCDRQFSEQVGRVVCRELGVETYNVVVRATYLYDYYIYGYDNPYIAKHFWMRTYTCRGDEQSRERCTQRLNYDVYACQKRRDYTFIRCGENIIANSTYGFWGNVRIASEELEQTGRLDRTKDDSRLEFVHFHGAGVLHGERVAALETTYVYPRLNYISIKACAWHGVDIIAPRGFVRVTNSSFEANLGRAFNILVLNGDSSSNEKTPFLPLKELSLPEHFVYGLVDMCSASKTIVVQDRVLVYYKYTDQTRACTKLFSSRTSGKQVAVRFLQLNLYEDPFTKNSIELFNGEKFNVTELLVELTASKVRTEADMRKSYITNKLYDNMGIHVHASPAGPMFGFLAEVVTVPISPMTYPDLKEEMTHSVLDTVFIRNAHGAIGYGGVGEKNPDLEVRTCRFLDNGLAVLNLTSPRTVDLLIQNARSFDFSNNYVFRNKGGFSSWLYASSGAQAIRGNITNNVFARTSHDIVLHLSGNHFNTLRVKRNFIVNNNVEMRDIVRVSGVIMQNFDYNYLYANIGDVILNVSGIDTLSQFSNYEWNGFYKNVAINYTRKTTVFCDSSQHRFRNNYFRNLENNYEMATGNMSKDRVESLQQGGTCPGPNEYCRVGWTLRRDLGQCVCYRRSPIDARFNWWGETGRFYAQSRIFDNADNDYLIRVNWDNQYATNETVLNKGIYCPPTWTFKNKQCFWYLGAPVMYSEAKRFCEFETNAILADSRRLVSWLTRLIELWQNNFAWINRYVWVSRAWIYSDKPTPNECPVVRNHWIEGYPCTKLIPFICQKSPYGSATILHVVAIVCVSVVAGIFLITGIIFCIFWVLKSRQRRLQRHHCKESARRQTIQRSNSLGTKPPTGGSFSGSTMHHSALLASQMLGGTLASTAPAGKRPDSAHPGMVLADSVDRLDRAQVDELRSNRHTVTGSRSTLISKPPTGSMASLDAADLIGAQKDIQQRQAPRAMYNPTEIPTEPHGAPATRNRPTMTRPQPYKSRPHPVSNMSTQNNSSEERPSYSSNYDDDGFSSSGAAKPPGGIAFHGAPKRGGYFSLSGHGSTTDSEFDDFDDTDSTVMKKGYLEGDSSLSGSRPPHYSRYEPQRPPSRHRSTYSSETDV